MSGPEVKVECPTDVKIVLTNPDTGAPILSVLNQNGDICVTLDSYADLTDLHSFEIMNLEL